MQYKDMRDNAYTKLVWLILDPQAFELD